MTRLELLEEVIGLMQTQNARQMVSRRSAEFVNDMEQRFEEYGENTHISQAQENWLQDIFNTLTG